ncbi:hypothetical protein ACP8HI_00760 [Paenibacillus sp. FA6]|uniref:hypothetical protein n=1 Tax=Paenibacillus sp. FA6 TaxID=3413029 RepID=UPI003F659E4B
MATIPGVYIIESLSFEDENENRYEGRLLKEILHLSGSKTIYKYIRTISELEYMIENFFESKYRYLHISCHGDQESFGLTIDNDVPFKIFCKMLKDFDNRRLFLSSCSVCNDSLIRNLKSNGKPLSVVGPSKDVGFSSAAIFWASIYHLMFSKEGEKMSNKNMKETLREISILYGLNMRSYIRSKNLYTKEDYCRK